MTQIHEFQELHSPQTDTDWPSWQNELLHSETTVQDLLREGRVSIDQAARLSSISNQYRIRITPYYASLMNHSLDGLCPIRLQAVPDLNEADPDLPQWAKHQSMRIYGRSVPWLADAIGDIEHLAAPRLTHRYAHRALLHLSSMCAVYCRFCFRKSHLNDEESTLYEGTLDPAFQYLKTHPEIHEIILTGGDPLSLNDTALKKLLERLESLGSIRVVRFHSRMAVTLPYRFTKDLISILARPWTFQIVLVSHFNHPVELTEVAKFALKSLKKTGVTLLNQSVLLKKVNDNEDTLYQLFQSLYENGVLPYYLHHPDWTPGTFAFRRSIEDGKRWMTALRGRLSGPALPDYILDIPQGYGKISLMNSDVRLVENLPGGLELGGREGGDIAGAVYQLTAPQTQKNPGKELYYLDLFRV